MFKSLSPELTDGFMAASVARQALADLGPRARTDWLYFLIVNAVIPLFERRVLQQKPFALYSALSILFNVGMMLYLRRWPSEIANSPVRAIRIFTVFKCGQNLSLACMTGWLFFHFGVNPVTSLITMVLMAFAQATMITLRPSVSIMRITLCCCLAPAAIASAWVGGTLSYGTALILLIEGVFLWIHGNRENQEYLRALYQTRLLMRARRKANRQGARIGDALLANAARHSATVAERNRIAYEWHDTLLAGFSAISWQLDEAVRRQREEPAGAAETIELARNMVHHYRAEARLVIADLLYEETGCEDLVSLIGKAVPTIIGSAPIAFVIDAFGKALPLSPNASRQLLRICQEAVTNAVRHAEPSRITVFLQFYAKNLSISISDNGCGFRDKAITTGHFGLQIMKQRACQLGGELSIDTAINSGTTVSVTVPYSADFTMTPTRILIVEDQCFSRLALHTVIDNHPDMNIVCDSDTGLAGVAAFREHSPDVTIVDLKLPDQSGIDVIKAIRRIDPLARIVVLSNFDGSEFLHRATEAGAMAYLTKDSNAEELLQAIRAVRLGQSFIPPSLLPLLESRVAGNDLTVREQGVLELLVLGWSNKQIGDHLGISEKTVRIHMSSIFSKLGVANRTQAVLVALQRGFVDPQPAEKAEEPAEQAEDTCDMGAS
jgi:DNA-binding NarL/FixJ family response regulator/signal transduction histidine kinase